MDLIQIKDLSFSYPSKKDTLKNINLKIKKGSFTCIVGENGSGKSTLLKCILGLYKGYTGEIKKEAHIGYLPQKSEIQSNFPATIEEVVLSGTIANNVRSIFYKKEDKERAKQVMEELGIYDIRKKCFADLSGGQQQRVLIARSLCATKDIIVLDEPTNGLDPSIAKQIYELLDKLKKEDNITVVFWDESGNKTLSYHPTEGRWDSISTEAEFARARKFTAIYNDELKRLTDEYGEQNKGKISLKQISQDMGGPTGDNNTLQKEIGNSIDYFI